MPVEQDVTVLVQELERIKPDAGDQGCGDPATPLANVMITAPLLRFGLAAKWLPTSHLQTRLSCQDRCTAVSLIWVLTRMPPLTCRDRPLL